MPSDGCKPGGANRPGDDRPQHRVAVVQQDVLVFVFAVAAEVEVGEHLGPIAAGGPGLDVARVAGADPGDERPEAEIRAAKFDQERGLGLNLRPNDLSPEPLSHAAAGAGLGGESLGLGRVAASGSIMPTGRWWPSQATNTPPAVGQARRAPPGCKSPAGGRPQ